MRLALGLRDVDEIGFGKPLRLLEHGTRDRDVVVPRETAHRLDRRIAERREPARQFGARLRLDLDDQSAEHQVEQPDMIVVEPARAVEKKGGHALERLRPAARVSRARSPRPVPE